MFSVKSCSNYSGHTYAHKSIRTGPLAARAWKATTAKTNAKMTDDLIEYVIIIYNYLWNRLGYRFLLVNTEGKWINRNVVHHWSITMNSRRYFTNEAYYAIMFINQ
jgi:hypothetical protein